MEQAILERLKIIQQKLLLLKNWDTALTFFGAKTHRYTMKPCVTEDELKYFEQRNQVVMPNEYRLFVANICNGAAGPNYGLSRFEPQSLPSSLSIPFPHREEWNLELPAPQTIEEEEEYAKTYFSDELVSGALHISTAGCYDLILIVSGPEQGSIWCDDRGSDNGIYPVSSSFVDWYEDWLDENLKKCPEFWITPPSFATNSPTK